MKFRTPLVLTALIAVSLTTATAETIDPRIAKSDPCGSYMVVHINGVNTDEVGARQNLERLAEVYGNAHDQHLITYRVAYNQTFGLVRDVVESYRQIIELYPPLTFRDFIRAAVLNIFSMAWTVDLIDAIGSAIRDLFNLERPISAYQADLTAMLNAINPNVDKKILLVAHSQGSLFANMLYDRMVEGFPYMGYGTTIRILPSAVAIVAVASAAQSTRRGLHITSDRDVVISGVRFAYPDTLAANISLARSEDDRAGHNFRAVYLAQAASQAAIVGAMNTWLRALEVSQPSPQWLSNFYLEVGWNACGDPGFLPGPCHRYMPETDWVIFYEPIIAYGSFPVDSYLRYRPGTLQDALNLANENIVPLHQWWTEEYVRLRMAGLPVTQPATNAWDIYSGDGAMAVRGQTSTWMFMGIPWGSGRATGGVTCRQPS